MSDLKSFNSQIIEEFRRWEGNVGEINEFYKDASLLLLTTTGRKSGRQITTPLAYRRDGERLILIAANVGSTKQPDWYYNILAQPMVTVELGTEKFLARVSILEGAERERFLRQAQAEWDESRENYPELPPFPAETERRVPIIALTLKRA
ncbi:nitroreductase/quinone reductase family protein [Ktedonosporobacter rubrisoli]|nr:nitroreductase/quinone reductase family protein [Ktedonosporobacter rubrisoli]